MKEITTNELDAVTGGLTPLIRGLLEKIVKSAESAANGELGSANDHNTNAMGDTF